MVEMARIPHVFTIPPGARFLDTLVGLLPGLVRRLDELGIEPAELQLRNASLDEVFLALTGKPAGEQPEEVTHMLEATR
jgi:hypothetical protein